MVAALERGAGPKYRTIWLISAFSAIWPRAKLPESGAAKKPPSLRVVGGGASSHFIREILKYKDRKW